jgi:CheY-like chemotaxis protein
MSEEIQSMVFEPFAQGERRTDQGATTGLGLGLALAERLVSLHGGTVDAHSAGPGRGSEFTVWLPRAPSPSAGVELRAPVSAVGRRILLIEDNLDAAETLATYLEMIGHVVEVENDGAAGIDAAHRFLPDVVVCDIGLPGALDGYAVARSLRANPRFSTTLLVALTGYGQEQDRRRAIDAGFDRHTTKPVDPTSLVALIAGDERDECVGTPISWLEI